MSAHRRRRPGRVRPVGQIVLASRGLHTRNSGHAGRSLPAARAARLRLAASGRRARRALAIGIGKGTRSSLRRLGQGNSTSFPGLAALAIDRDTLAGLAGQIPRGAVMVTGTNGKGTTCRLLAAVMNEAGLHPILNHEGSNEPSGLASTLLAHTGALGRLPADDRAIGLFEVDEGSLPEILPQVQPVVLVFTNVFRDQMDRYLELDCLTSRWEQALQAVPAGTTLVLNADDPRLACLASGLGNPRLYYGLEDDAQDRGTDSTSDFPRCPRCSGELAYSRVFCAHLGHWACTQCGLARPAPQVRAAKIDLIGSSSSRLQVESPSGDAVLEVPLPGLYNAYNTVAAVAAATACQLPGSALPAVADVTPGSLRMEQVTIGGRHVHLVLAKNANGYTEVLRALLRDGRPRHLLLGLNDSVSNQQPDVSWIWDIDFESLRGLVPAAVTTGNRASDLAVRLKYAGWMAPATGTSVTQVAVQADPVLALQLALRRMPTGQPLWVVSTYLVLSQIRDWLRRQGVVGAPWER